MSADAQSRLVGEPTGESVTIETDARTLRPFFDIAGTLVNECRLHVSLDGLRIKAVDPANVAMVDVQLHTDALETFDATGETTVGLPLATLQDVLKSARWGKTNPDDLTVSVDSSSTRVEIEREYGGTEVTQRDEFLNIDSAAVRQEPDMPALEAQVFEATFDAYGLRETLAHIDTLADHVRFEAIGDDLHIQGVGRKEDNEIAEASAVTAHGVVTERTDDHNGVAKFSLDYFTDLAKAAHKADAETVTLHWGEEYPLTMLFSRETDDGYVYDAEYMLAPRIGGADE